MTLPLNTEPDDDLAGDGSMVETLSESSSVVIKAIQGSCLRPSETDDTFLSAAQSLMIRVLELPIPIVVPVHGTSPRISGSVTSVTSLVTDEEEALAVIISRPSSYRSS